MRIVYTLLFLLLIPAALAHGNDNEHFYETFVRHGNFAGVLAVGNEAEDVAAALELSLILQTHATQSTVSAITYEEYDGEPGIIVTSGDVEHNFQDVLDACAINAQKYARLATFCEQDGATYYIVYAQNGEVLMDLARDIASGKIKGDNFAIPREEPELPAIQVASEDQGDTAQDTMANIENAAAVHITTPEQDNATELSEKRDAQIAANQNNSQGFFSRIASWLKNLFT